MKSIVNRSIMVGIATAITQLLIFGFLFFVTFPVDNWSELWSRHLFEIPFIIVVPSLSLVIGIVVGIISGIYWRKKLSEIQQALSSISKGTPISHEKLDGHTEVVAIKDMLVELEKQIIDQKKRSQKLTNERVEDQEKQINQVITDERNRLARELHDSVSQELFAASMMISAINESNSGLSEAASKHLLQVEAMIQQSQLEMRALLLHLRPVALKDKSLTEGIRLLLEELKQKVPMTITWNIEEIKLNKGVEDHLFRILQESVSNTLRHAKAETLHIMLIERQNVTILSIADDGVGFHLEEKETSSYGIQNMKERAAEIGATLRIISVPNKGTRLEVRVPMIDTEGD